MHQLRCIFSILIFTCCSVFGQSILIPMDEGQRNHLKSYGIAFSVLQQDQTVDWLLNYRGGSFLIDWNTSVETECRVRGVSYERLAATQVSAILAEIESPPVNMSVVTLEKAPRIAVYSPKNELIQDDTDAVMLVLNYSEIPYTIIYDEEVLKDELVKFDWLHLHHEDFTGQHGRFIRRESSKIEAEVQKLTAQRLGYTKVSAMKYDVVSKIKGFCAGGGYLFAMCSGAETFDIALAAQGVDISDSFFDGDDMDPQAQQKLDFTKTFAFEKFTLEPGHSRKFSDINSGRFDFSERAKGYFSLFQFSAKWDIIPSLLTQNHTSYIREFQGQTTAFNAFTVKPGATILGENRQAGNVRYLYGEIGKGHWTFYSGHDPEGSTMRWHETTDLNQHPSSPGYRLILNNVLFPSAKKKKHKT